MLLNCQCWAIDHLEITESSFCWWCILIMWCVSQLDLCLNLALTILWLEMSMKHFRFKECESYHCNTCLKMLNQTSKYDVYSHNVKIKRQYYTCNMHQKFDVHLSHSILCTVNVQQVWSSSTKMRKIVLQACNSSVQARLNPAHRTSMFRVITRFTNISLWAYVG